MNKLDYEEWLAVYDEELKIADAETGADRELDYDEETLRERQYEEYLNEGES
jgi:hypothetical protein